MKYFHIFVLSTIYLIYFTCGSVRFAFYEEALTFNGLSRDVKDVNKERCAARFVFENNTVVKENIIFLRQEAISLYTFQNIKNFFFQMELLCFVVLF